MKCNDVCYRLIFLTICSPLTHSHYAQPYWIRVSAYERHEQRPLLARQLRNCLWLCVLSRWHGVSRRQRNRNVLRRQIFLRVRLRLHGVSCWVRVPLDLRRLRCHAVQQRILFGGGGRVLLALSRRVFLPLAGKYLSCFCSFISCRTDAISIGCFAVLTSSYFLSHTT